MPTDRNLIRQEVNAYASALLQGAKAEGAVFEVSTQLKEVLETVRGNAKLKSSLADETIPASARAGVVRELFADKSPSLLSVLCVMVERGDVALLGRIEHAYSQLAEEDLGAVIVDVTSAVELDDHLREVIKRKLSADFGCDAILREHVDKSILGGIIMSARGKRIDASMTTQLERARVTLSTQSAGGEK